ncbi:sterol carrier protein 2 [Quaeritorhiza haematococci]|nr:sterol carrier protein 2 [Quaeritorhiza haematococci]
MSGKLAARKAYIVGVGMTKFVKPGSVDADYPDFGLEAATKALIDANVTYDQVELAAVGYVYGDSTCGQRTLYQLGLTQIPILNVNNNCSTGSTALYLARQAVEGGIVDCALALGFEKMQPGALNAMFTDRTQPLDKAIEIMSEIRGLEPVPINPQIFGNGGLEYCEKYPGNTPEHFAMIGEKNHKHSTLNPYSQFTKAYSFDQIKGSRPIYGPLTLLQCSPTSDGAACAIVASESFIRKHGLENQAIEIVAQVMATDSTAAFAIGGKPKSAIEITGADMTRRAASEAYKIAGITPADVDIVELHDCFSPNELLSYDALGLCEPGKAGEFVASGAPWHPKFSSSAPALAGRQNPPRRVVVNASGGLISKGHPLGATGLAQACELTWQLRGWCGDRQVPNIRYALQHNIGLGGAVVVGIYRKAHLGPTFHKQPVQDPRERFGYNPATAAKGVKEADVLRVMSRKGALIGTKEGGLVDEVVKARL